MTEADALLEQVKVAYWQGRKRYRDSMLETGRLIHRFMLAHIRQGDDLSEEQRLAAGYTHYNGQRRVATALEVPVATVCRLVAVAQAVNLLSDGGQVGRFSWEACRLFWRFVRRSTRSQTGTRPGRGGLLASSAETWVVKSEFDGKAQQLFRQGVVDGLTCEEIRPAVLRLYTGSGARKSAQKRCEGLPERSALLTLQASAAVAAPGDLAEICWELIGRAESPEAVMQRLEAMLRQHQAERKWEKVLHA